MAAQLQRGAEAERAGPLISGAAPPAFVGEALWAAPWARPGRRVNIPRALSALSLSPQRLMVRVNFVYKVPFVGEGGESPQL